MLGMFFDVFQRMTFSVLLAN